MRVVELLLAMSPDERKRAFDVLEAFAESFPEPLRLVANAVMRAAFARVYLATRRKEKPC